MQEQINIGDTVEILSLQETLQPHGAFDFRQFGVVEGLLPEEENEEQLASVKPKQKRQTIEVKISDLKKVDEEFYKSVANYPSDKALKAEELEKEATTEEEFKKEDDTAEESTEKTNQEITNFDGTNDHVEFNSKTTTEKAPWLRFRRNGAGLLESIDYSFDEDGSVNWRKLIPEEFLYPNRSYFERYNRPVPPTIDGLGDDKLCIRLGGIKALAKIRGFKSVKADVLKTSMNQATVKCSITWIPNYETDYEECTFEEVATAHEHNTDAMSKKFLESIAFNRAFVRAVRAFLNINIVGDDEIDKSPPDEKETTDLSPNGKLKEMLAKKKSINSYEEFKNILRDWHKEDVYRNSEEIKTWADFSDIPAKDCRIFIGLLNS